MQGVNRSLHEKIHSNHLAIVIIFSIAIGFVVTCYPKSLVWPRQSRGARPAAHWTPLRFTFSPVAGLLGRCGSSRGRHTGPEQDGQKSDGEDPHLLLHVLWLPLRIWWPRPTQRCHRLVIPPNRALPLPRDPPPSSPLSSPVSFLSIYSFGTMCC